MYQWEDGSLAYFSVYKRYKEAPSCGNLLQYGILLIYHCYFEDTSRFLCEESGTERDIYTRKYDVPGVPDNSSVHFPHVVCPSGHWTHEFLACDVQSACWRSDTMGQSSERDTCQSSLSTLFTCRNGVEHVPYSLVCDHSQDCQDFSDEDFCVHPSCSGSWQFECNNGQVRFWFVGCQISQQHANVAWGRICSDICTCCHTEIEVTDQTCYLTQSQYSDTVQAIPGADPELPGAGWQGSDCKDTSDGITASDASSLPPTSSQTTYCQITVSEHLSWKKECWRLQHSIDSPPPPPPHSRIPSRSPNPYKLQMTTSLG